jgi:hypothetical protein
MENPVVKSVAKKLSPKRIESVLAIYAGVRKPEGLAEKNVFLHSVESHQECC